MKRILLLSVVLMFLLTSCLPFLEPHTPEQTTLQEPISDITTPQATPPENTTPENTTPENTTPEVTTPPEPPHQHLFDRVTVTKEPTCVQNGT